MFATALNNICNDLGSNAICPSFNSCDAGVKVANMQSHNAYIYTICIDLVIYETVAHRTNKKKHYENTKENK